jgi:hypothetical protein
MAKEIVLRLFLTDRQVAMVDLLVHAHNKAMQEAGEDTQLSHEEWLHGIFLTWLKDEFKREFNPPRWIGGQDGN